MDGFDKSESDVAGIVSWGKGEALKVEEIQVEAPKSFEVRLKMLYASVCHTDVLFANGFPIPCFPRIMGHEGVGVVESIGEGVTGLREGDLVIPTYIGECKTCDNCMSNKSNLCKKYPLSYNGLMLDGTSRMSIGGQTAYHAFTCSTWCEYTVINVNFVLKIDPQIPLSDASFLSCGFSTGYGAAWKEAQVENGSSVAVFGLGAVGLGAINGAKCQGASRVIGIDNNPRKEAKGRAFGMTDFINPEESDKPIEELVRDLGVGMGVDYSFECTGVPSLINQAILSTKLEIQLDELLTHEIKLEDAYKAFELLKQPDCVKILIKI
ncbi:hypothetical protein V6N13_088818 [Hibiscus sabdariffa]